MTDTYFYEPSRGHGLPHSPLKAIVAPRPIGWISTVDREGRVNLAPYSFFNCLSEDPPIVGFSSRGHKNSLVNARDTGEFVANLCTLALAHEMNVSGIDVPPGVDEMALAGLAAAPSTLVKPPRVAASPAALECKVIEVKELHDLKGRSAGWHLVLGEIVGVHIDPAYLRDGLFDTAAAASLARCGYLADYCATERVFQMPRIKDVAEIPERARQRP